MTVSVLCTVKPPVGKYVLTSQAWGEESLRPQLVVGPLPAGEHK